MNQQAWLDEEDAMVTSVVRKHGWLIQYIGGGECSRPGCGAHDDGEVPFAYTVGLFGMNHPKLLILGASPETARLVLNHIGGLAPLQLSYDDGNGRFPWDDGFLHPELQPRPGPFRAWLS